MQKKQNSIKDDVSFFALFMEHLSQVENGSVSIVKQDNIAIQINLCERNSPEKGRVV